ncbi:LysR family transcriptional regulator [Neptunicella marina]|uniref:LysR family transcriptional regulator n=1 Tax=Neptunicella marina TaxID=2125989 RepID=A0A8J6J1H4_9ALTE|nr:LysR family transcriptional regulator [Neptunicella marina]MBC3767833.1 LysR family transcriptional regulator [Neptunicella marina]
MNVSIKQLNIFTELANCGSFAEAATKLHLSQPALSIAIKNFEQEVGGQLFSRNTRNLQLTPEGAAFLPVAKRLMRDWDIAFDDLHKRYRLQQGKLTIACMPSFAASLLPQVLAEFHQTHSNINLAVQDVVMEQVIDSVLNDRADLGIIFEPTNTDGLTFIPLFEDSFMLVMPSKHYLNLDESIHWQDLKGQKVIAMNRGSALRDWFDEALSHNDTQVNIVAEAGQLATVGQLVRSGLGIAVIPALCQQQMQQNGLVCLPLKGQHDHKRVGVITRSRGGISVAAQALLDNLQNTLWPQKW